MGKYFAVMAGGAIGAASRFLIGTLIARLYAATFPLGTFVINITGSFLIGVLMTLFLRRPNFDVNWRLFLVTGILGGYTTFSSFEWEALVALRTGASAVALLYLGLSVALGLGVRGRACCWLNGCGRKRGAASRRRDALSVEDVGDFDIADGDEPTVHHFFEQGQCGGDLFGALDNRNHNGQIAAEQVRMVELGCFAEAFKSAEGGGSGQFQFAATIDDGFKKGLAAVAILLVDIEAQEFGGLAAHDSVPSWPGRR
jgi:fluoride exporter